MKKKLTWLSTALVFLFMVGMAEALLIDQGNGVIYDDSAKQYWYQDLSAFTNQTYDQQLDAIDALNNPVTGLTSDDYGDWRMAQYVNDIINLENYDAYKITDKFKNPYEFYDSGEGKTTLFFSGHMVYALANQGNNYVNEYLKYIYDDGRPDEARFGFGFNFPDGSSSEKVGAWIVADATPVPEPSTIIISSLMLLGAGIYTRRKFKKK